MRLRGGGGGGGGEGLSLAICMMSSMQEGNGGWGVGGLMGNHCAGLMGKVKLLLQKKFGARHPHFHGDKLRRRSANERARFPE